MLSTDEPYGGWPRSGEIDIMEIIGSEPDVLHGTIHFGQIWPNNSSSGQDYKLHSGIFNDEFHEFAIEWEDGEIRWFIDDYLYFVQRPGNVSPQRWPFDQDFHFLLNVAVGGNWPGQPNSTTSFPQTMEVEYVRVYDGFQPYISGNRQVSNQATGVKYTIENATEESSFNWKLPQGATLVSGEGTNQITVDWEDVGGDIEVEVQDACNTYNMELNVYVEPALVKELSFENFDEEALIRYNFSSGSFIDNVDNPAPNEVNSTNLVGQYVRDDNTVFDVLVYDVTNFNNAAPFVEGEKKIFIDLYTDAPVGTEVLLQFERKSTAQPENYPTGRHSRHQVFTTKQNEWERLEFKFLDRPDGSVPNSVIDQFIILFAPNSSNSSTYYFDNLDTYGFDQSVSIEVIDAQKANLLSISPNPGKEQFILKNLIGKSITELRYINQSGTVVLK